MNSLVGATTEDNVGSLGATALTNGNYVVSSHTWNGAQAIAGAATWANGTTGLVGVVSAANSLVGSRLGDLVGGRGVIALSNGNYVVSSPGWANGTNAKAGAATWGNGTTGISGTISAGNSLVGLNADDGTPPSTAGYYLSVVALANGNYVVVNPGWDNGAIADVGAVTWANGATGRSGVITTANSLIGSVAGDAVGSSPTVALTNGNYVVGSNLWHRGAVATAGAATWGNGLTGRVGVVSTSNSLVGTSANDNVGRSIYALENGNYVVAAELWDDGATVDMGAVVWRSGSSGSGTEVSRHNAMVGNSAGDAYGTAVLTLGNGDFVAGTGIWNRASILDAGTFTHIDGTVGLADRVLVDNSISGFLENDRVASGNRIRLGDHHYAIFSPRWTNSGLANAGAITILQNTTPTRGRVSIANSVIGGEAGGGYRLNVVHDTFLDRAVVSRTAENMVTLRPLPLFAHGCE